VVAPRSADCQLVKKMVDAKLLKSSVVAEVSSGLDGTGMTNARRFAKWTGDIMYRIIVTLTRILLSEICDSLGSEG
jgi:hypothetical protein